VRCVFFFATLAEVAPVLLALAVVALSEALFFFRWWIRCVVVGTVVPESAAEVLAREAGPVGSVAARGPISPAKLKPIPTMSKR
jgi:hypothetical protein